MLGAIMAGPAGAIVGASLGPLLEPYAAKVWEELSADSMRRAGETLAAACEALGCEPEELDSMMRASDRTRLLAGTAISAAIRTVWPAKVRTLGRALASGLLADDDATIDIEQLILAAMADIEASQLSLLELLACRVPPQAVGDEPIEHPRQTEHGWFLPRHGWTEAQISRYRSHLGPVVPSLLGTLQRHGLVAQGDNTAVALHQALEEVQHKSAQQYKPRAGLPSSAPPVASVPEARVRRLTPPPSWSATDLGEQVLGRYREAGAELPGGWAPRPSGQDASPQ